MCGKLSGDEVAYHAAIERAIEGPLVAALHQS